MGFDPRRWRPSSGSRPLTTNVEALLAENEALRREVRSLRLQLEAVLQGDSGSDRPRQPTDDDTPPAEVAAEERQGVWSSPSRARATRSSWRSAEPPRSRVTVGSSHGISPDLVERWGHALARHPRWQELRIGPPGGLRGLEDALRRQWWNPALSLEQELDRRSPGLGAELAEALRGPHSRVRWAVRAAFALHGPRAPEWLSEEPLRVVQDLLRRVEQLEQRAGSGPRRPGTRSASGAAEPGPEPSDRKRDQAERDGGDDRRQDASQRRDGPGGADGQRQKRSAHRSQGSCRGQVDPRREALALLGLEPGASATAIKRAYRRLAKAHHPDLGGDVEAFRRLDAAYRSLL